MSATITCLGGFGGKGAAAILVEAAGKRLLLDAGGALHPGETLAWAQHLDEQALDVDAVLISHDHIDHIGGVDKLALSIPIYCTPLVAQALPPGRVWHALPERGRCQVAGVTVTTGQAGHSLGGVWLHLAVAGGIFYSGDACFESRVYPLDSPPPARLALLDASYGAYDTPQHDCLTAIETHLKHPLALPVPASGRALEMALWLGEEADRRCLGLAIAPVIRAHLAILLTLPETLRRPGVTAAIETLLARPDAPHPSLYLFDDNDDTAAMWPQHRLLHTGYLTPARCVELAAGQIFWQRWNVHLRASHLVALADDLGADVVVPLFTSLDEPNASVWRHLLGRRFTAQRTLSLPHSHRLSLTSWSMA